MNTTTNNNNKYQKLFIGIILDLIGVFTSSWILFGIGDFSDIIWAPFSAWMMMRMYKGTAGKVAGAITFIEEALPAIDIVPTYTLMWVYTYLIKGNAVEKFIKSEDN